MIRKSLMLVLFVGLVFISSLYYLGKQPDSKNINSIKINPSKTLQVQEDIEILSQNLNIPWEVVFLPDGEILITERPGTLVLIKNGKKIEIEGVRHVGEGGLLGLAIHPNFSQNRFIYLYLTSQDSRGLTNRVERYRFQDNKLSDKKVILDGIGGSSNHDGGRIIFGPNKLLYITTGDAENSQSAQDINSLNGKILRIKDDGSIPSDNPFGNAVFSYGHRNPQGLAFDNQGRLWATEHGRSGIQSGFDELNLIEKGKNYGWPEIQGDEKRQGMVSPIVHSGPDTTWAPSGAVFLPAGRQGYKGSIFFAGLKGEALYEYNISQNLLKEHFKGEFGRIRTVVIGPQNKLYILTSNRDGRGNPVNNDDRLIKINPEKL